MAIEVTKILTTSKGGDSSGVTLAAFANNTRTQASYSPAAQGVAAMTSDLDVVLTIPTGATKTFLTWDIMGDVDANANGRTGFVVYKDEDGGGFTLLPNSRDGSSNYYSVITTYVNDPNFTTTPSTTSVSIIDESPTVGTVTTYRIYVANTSAGTAGTYYLNKAVSAVGSESESGLSTCMGMCT